MNSCSPGLQPVAHNALHVCTPVESDPQDIRFGNCRSGTNPAHESH